LSESLKYLLSKLIHITFIIKKVQKLNLK